MNKRRISNQEAWICKSHKTEAHRPLVRDILAAIDMGKLVSPRWKLTIRVPDPCNAKMNKSRIPNRGMYETSILC